MLTFLKDYCAKRSISHYSLVYSEHNLKKILKIAKRYQDRYIIDDISLYETLRLRHRSIYDLSKNLREHVARFKNMKHFKATPFLDKISVSAMDYFTLSQGKYIHGKDSISYLIEIAESCIAIMETTDNPEYKEIMHVYANPLLEDTFITIVYFLNKIF